MSYFHLRDYLKNKLKLKLDNRYSIEKYNTSPICHHIIFNNYSLDNIYTGAIYNDEDLELVAIYSLVIDKNCNLHMKSGTNINNLNTFEKYSILDGTSINSKFDQLFWFDNNNNTSDLNTMLDNIPTQPSLSDSEVSVYQEQPPYLTIPLVPSSVHMNISAESIDFLQSSPEVEPLPSPEHNSLTPPLVYHSDNVNEYINDSAEGMPDLVDMYDQIVNPYGFEGPIYNKYFKTTSNGIFYNSFNQAKEHALYLFNNQINTHISITQNWKGWSVRCGPIWITSSNRQKKINNLDFSHVTYTLTT